MQFKRLINSRFSFPCQSINTMPYSLKEGLVTCFFTEKKSKTKKNDDVVDSPTILTFPTGALSADERSQVSMALQASNISEKKYDKRVFYSVAGLPFQTVAVAAGPTDESSVFYRSDNIRTSFSHGTKTLLSQGVKTILVDPIEHLDVAIEGAVLGTYNYTKFFSRQSELEFSIFRLHDVDNSLVQKAMLSELFAHAQNFTRFLADRPANQCTPTYFCNFMENFARVNVHPRLSSPSNLTVEAKDRAWAEQQGMGSFLSVSNGSVQEPKFLIMEYKGHLENQVNLAVESKPIVFVGKGVTFDSGGISIKPSSDMAHMKADMQGAAVTAMTLMTAAFARAPVHLVCITPLTENLPSGTATKPGDVVTASNGITIEIDNTDAEGRLILADALVYAHKFNPKVIIDVATLTGAIDVALGYYTSGMFSRSDEIALELEAAGMSAGDRVWRMPLFPEYRSMMDSNVADIINSSGKRSAGSCTAAAFLNDFVEEDVQWVHLDIAGAMLARSDEGPLPKGMTGRPIRTLLYWLYKRSGESWPSLTKDNVNAFRKFLIPPA